MQPQALLQDWAGSQAGFSIPARLQAAFSHLVGAQCWAPLLGAVVGGAPRLLRGTVQASWLNGARSHARQLGLAGGLAPCQGGRMCSTASRCVPEGWDWRLCAAVRQTYESAMWSKCSRSSYPSSAALLGLRGPWECFSFPLTLLRFS